MGASFLPNMNVSAPCMYLAVELRDRWPFEADDPIPFDLVKPNAFDNDEVFGRWPTRDKLFGGAGFQDPMMGNGWFDVNPVEYCGSAHWPYRIIGLAKDQYGNVKSGCRARLFRTSDDMLIAETTTKGDGEYAFGVSDNTTQYYVVIFQASPPLAGISVRTLTGA